MPVGSPAWASPLPGDGVLDYRRTRVTVQVHAVQRRDGVIVRDISYSAGGGPAVRAYLVEPDGSGRAHERAGVLYLHWFNPGNPTSSRLEFLEEAVGLAPRGTVSLLPDLTFPWNGDPVGDPTDLRAVVEQTIQVRRGLDLLQDRRDVDGRRIGVVGHDYGGMYGLMVATVDRNRVRTAVAVNVDATFSNWFLQFWLGFEGDAATAYQRLLEPVDPIRYVPFGPRAERSTSSRCRTSSFPTPPPGRCSRPPHTRRTSGCTRARPTNWTIPRRGPTASPGWPNAWRWPGRDGRGARAAGLPAHYARRMRTWSFRTADDPTPPALGGRLCLAFVNSILWRRSAEPTDLLVDYRAMVAYLRRVGLLTGAERAALDTASAAHPVIARRVHADSIALREALFRLLSAMAHDARPAPADLAVLTTRLREGLAHLTVVASDRGKLTASWRGSGHRLDWPIWEVAGSAAGLLLPGEPTWLKQCPGERCGWLFVDRSRSHTRRWCASTMCGNRDRARRHHQRVSYAAARKYHAAREMATKPSDT